MRGEQPAEWSPAVSATPLIIIALALVACLLIRHLLTPAVGNAFGWGDMGLVAFALAATTPLFLHTPLAVTLELGMAWGVFAILLVDRERLAAESRAGKLSLLGLFFFSLLLRWSLSSGGPGDLHLNLAAIWSPELDPRWGQAPIALFRGLGVIVGGVRDTHIIWCNLILSSVLPLLLYGIVAELGVGKVAALLAAFVAAAHPLLIVFSGVLERQPTYLFAAFGSILALLGFLKRGGWARFIAFVLGTVLATASRPEGAQVVILDWGVLLLVPASRRTRGVVTLGLALLTTLSFAYARQLGDFGPGGGGLRSSITDPAPLLWTVLFSPDFTPVAWIVAWALGLLLGVRRRAAWIALTAVLGLDLVWKWTGVYKMFFGIERQVASARYETILLIPFVIGVALLIQAVSKLRAAWTVSLAAAFIVSTALTFGRPYRTLLTPFTIDYEYRFLRKYALTLPPRARLYIFDSPIADEGFDEAHLVGRFVGSPVRFEDWRERQCDELAGDLSQTYLYVGSSCAEHISNRASPEEDRWMEDCALIRARITGHAVEEIAVPAKKFAWADFKDRTVLLGVYQLTDPSICAVGPRSSLPRRPSAM